MDSMKRVVNAFMLDIDNYLTFCKEYGKPSYKYFNFVVNKMGLLCIFEAKNKLFNSNSNAFRFVDGVFVELKCKFLGEEDGIVRAAIVFFMGKVYFTDDTAQALRLRITAEEWDVFSSYIDLTKREPPYLPIFIIINHLIGADFFRFTVKNKSLALDYGSSENEVASSVDLQRDKVFWDELKRDVANLEHREVAELKQLKSIHDELMQPYIERLPESNDLEEALELFNEIKQILNQPQSAAVSRNMTKRQISEACDEFLKPSTSQINQRSSRYDYASESESDDIDLDDLESLLSKTNTTTKKKVRNRRKKPAKRKQDVREQKDAAGKMEVDGSTTESNSETDTSSRKTMSSIRQNVMKGVGAEAYSEKLKRYYED